MATCLDPLSKTPVARIKIYLKYLLYNIIKSAFFEHTDKMIGLSIKNVDQR